MKNSEILAINKKILAINKKITELQLLIPLPKSKCKTCGKMYTVGFAIGMCNSCYIDSVND